MTLSFVVTSQTAMTPTPFPVRVIAI
jgi:hypothetical protein